MADVNADNGWRLVWSDEFSGAGGSAPDPGKWGYDTGGTGWGNNEKQCYTNSTNNAYLDGDGHLVIKAVKENREGMAYTSARLVSRGKGDWTYGRVEVRAKLPSGKGMWPAIWMLPTDWEYGAWPISGEIDIMEQRGSDPLKVMGTIHFGNPWKYIGSDYRLPDAGYHVYAVEWESHEIRWYVDGNLYQTRKANEWYSSGGQSPAPFNKRFHILLNVAVGGNFDGDPDGSTTFPQTMMVDYVRVYERSAAPAAPAANLPAKIEAESYSAMSGVQTENTADSGGGQNVGWIETGDWMDYKVNVPEAGGYTVEYRVASQGTTGQIQLKSGSSVLASTAVPNTGGWQNWQTVSANVQLAAGQQTLRVFAGGGGFNLNWINFSRPQGRNLLTNPGFESGDLSGWFEWHSGALAQKADKDQPRAGGSFKLTHWAPGAYQQITAQKVNVPNGLYKASVWVRSGGGQKALKLYVKDYGGAELSGDIGTSPVTEYRQYTIDDIQVTNGQIEVGIWNDANANNWAAFDDFELVKK